MKLKDLKNEIKVLDIAALINKAKAVQIEINDLVLDKNINKIKDLKSINKKRKEMARVLTSMNQKKLIALLEPKTEKATASAVVPSQGEGSAKKAEKTEKGGSK